MRTINRLSDEQFIWALGIEAEWKQSLPRFTERGWLNIFPEARALLPEKTEEWNQKFESLNQQILQTARSIYTAELEPLGEEILVGWILYQGAIGLLNTKRHLLRLKRAINAFSNSLEYDFDSRIRLAKQVSIIELASNDIELIKRGSTYCGLCPFHHEKTASFFVFPKTAHFKCFGCGESGDVITYCMKINNVSFLEAVRSLCKGII